MEDFFWFIVSVCVMWFHCSWITVRQTMMVGAEDRAEMLISWWPGKEGELSPSKRPSPVTYFMVVVSISR